MANERTPTSQRDAAGLAARRIAVDILDGVLRRHRPLDEQLDDRAAHPDFAALAHRDRALVRALVTVVLRRLGTLRHLLGQWLKLPADAPRVETVLLVGAAQILWLDVADHAAVDLAVRLVQADRRAARYAGLVNAVLRRVTREGAQFLAGIDTIALDTPEWLMARWVKTYGTAIARAIAVANGQEPALDVTVKDDPEHWASALGGRVLPTGSVRAIVHGAISQLPGDAGEALRRGARPQRRGSVRGTGRQDRPARGRGRPRHRRRPRPGKARTAAGEPRSPPSRRRNGRGRRHAMAGRAVRRRPPRRPVLVDGDHPPPSRHPLAQARGRHRRARSPATAARGPGERADEAGRHSCLLHLLARAGGGSRRHPRSPRSQPEPAPPADLGGRSPRSP